MIAFLPRSVKGHHLLLNSPREKGSTEGIRWARHARRRDRRE